MPPFTKTFKMRAFLILLFLATFFELKSSDLSHDNNPRVLSIHQGGDSRSNRLKTLKKHCLLLRLDRADSIIDSGAEKEWSRRSKAWRHRNPGNLEPSGQSRKFKSMRMGFKALEEHVKAYQEGRHRYSSQATRTLEGYCRKYAEDPNYTAKMVSDLKLAPTTLIADIETDSLVKYHIKREDHKLFKIIYK